MQQKKAKVPGPKPHDIVLVIVVNWEVTSKWKNQSTNQMVNLQVNE